MNRIKVLIVDDKDENLYLMESVLVPEQFECYKASNGIQALECARLNRPDIIISDVLMPQMDGYTLCREIKKDIMLRNIPFIFYTATYNHPNDAEYGLNLGADRFILKHQDPDEFLKIVLEVLKRFKTKSLAPPIIHEMPEEVVLKEYNETLVRKLEDKILQTEKAEKELRMYAAMLEEEIRHRKLTEEQLRLSENKYRSIFESVKDVYYRVALDGKVLEISPSLQWFIGYAPDEVIDTQVSDLYYNPQDRINLLARIQEKKEINDYVIRIKAKCGEIKYGSINAKLIYDSDHTPVYLEGAIRDITERVQAEKRTRILGQALEQSPSTVVITDREGNIEYVNAKFAEVTGYKPEEVIGKNPRILKSGSQGDDFYRNLWSTILSGKNWSGVIRNLKRNGELFWERAIISPIANEDNLITHFISIKEDITKEKEMHEELVRAKIKAEESDRLKTAFLQNLSHELRTPMNGILGFTQILIENEENKVLNREYLDFIEKSGFRLLNIMNDLVEISKIETGQICIHNEDFNINETFKELYAIFKIEAEVKGIEINITGFLPENVCVIYGDKGKIYQVLSNFLKNAVKFTRKGFINFGCIEKKGFLQFYVEDTGIGVKPDLTEIIFERFVQADSSNTRSYEGAGLGLSISKGFVDKMGGKIWVESKVQTGSTFFFTLPSPLRKAPNVELDREKAFISDSFRQSTIMIVEDDYVNYLYLNELLKREGLFVIGARSGQEAIQLSDQFPNLRLILMDLKMPEFSGYETLKSIRQMGITIPIIAQTAYADHAEKEKALSEGFDGFLTKPLNKSEVVQCIRSFLAYEDEK